MSHPLVGKKVILYGSFWIVIAVIQATLFFYYLEMPIQASITDSFVFNFLFAVFCFSYWYVVKYVSPSGQGLASAVIIHFIGVGFSVTALSFLTTTILSLLFNDPGYISSTFFFRIVVGYIYFLIVIMLYYLLIYIENVNKNDQKAAHLQHLLKQSELEMLKFQINPHFLFNSLNSISALTVTSPGQAREMVIKLADFFRTSLGKASAELHTLEEELKQMNLYLEIEKIRFGKRLVIDNEIADSCLNLRLPGLILQPLYENAIKFGMYGQLGNTTLKTTAECREGLLKIAIANNFDPGVGSIRGNGIGIQNVANRMELIYGMANLVSINRQVDTFTISLTIPQALP